MENGIRTVAFPFISTGIYGYFVEKAAKKAVGGSLSVSGIVSRCGRFG